MAQLTDDCFAFGGPLMTVEDAARLMAERVRSVEEAEDLPLLACDGRILAADLVAPLPLPPFANSAVDGYAVRHADLPGQGATVLPVTGRVAAGRAASGVAAAGGAVRVFTGAPMPAGADTVIMQEDVTLPEAGMVSLPQGLKRGANMRPAGEDVAKGECALRAGRRLGPADLSLAAALGQRSLTVRRQLVVGVFSTGDELREAGETLPEAAIYDANRMLLLSLLKRAGVEGVDLGILRDEAGALASRLREAARSCDLVLTSGGVSTGEEDHVKAAVEKVGALALWRIAIKPGRPVAMGVIDGAAFVGLPGNPVAVYVTFAFIVRPLLALLAGESWTAPRRIAVTSGFAYKKKPGRREYVRVSLQPNDDGSFTALKHPRDGAGMLSSLTGTHGLLELGDDLPGLKPGDPARFIAYGDLA